jgi:hypothetical protein
MQPYIVLIRRGDCKHLEDERFAAGNEGVALDTTMSLHNGPQNAPFCLHLGSWQIHNPIAITTSNACFRPGAEPSCERGRQRLGRSARRRASLSSELPLWHGIRHEPAAPASYVVWGLSALERKRCAHARLAGGFVPDGQAG